MLSSYRVTPQSMGWVSPAELMFGRKLRATLDLLQPDRSGNWVWQGQVKQKQNHDAHFKQRDFEVGTMVYVFNIHRTSKWLPGTIKQISSLASVLAKLSDGCTFCRHSNDINIRLHKTFMM